MPPEELLADEQRWHAELSARDRPVRVVAQSLLQRRICEGALRIDDAELLGEICDDCRRTHVAAVAEDGIEDDAGRAPIAACRDDQSQRRERVEWMRRREAHRQPQA